MELNWESTHHQLDTRVDHRPLSLPKKEDDKCYHAITINRSPSEVYTFCENQNNFDAFIREMELGYNWNVRLVKDPANRTIAWHSTEHSEIKTLGQVWFSEAPRRLGTVATLVMDYSIPGGKLNELVAKFKGEDFDSMILTNLKQIKCFLETGEIATTKGQTSGREEDLIHSEERSL